MITVHLNEANFEYDIHSLVKAFYPQEEVLVTADAIETEASLHIEVRYERETGASGNTGSISFAMNGTTAETAVNHADRKETKNRLKQTLYRLLKAQTGKELPWGTLTGIRPTKIAMGMLEEGKSDEAVSAYMKDVYLTSDEKIDLSLRVAKKEKALLDRLDAKNGYSLYIGIPFCPTTCLYCSFTSFPIAKWQARVDEYLYCLEKEMRFIAGAMKGRKLDTVYIGGGTPTSLEPAQLDRLLTSIENIFDLGQALEFTVEGGRPDSITKEKLAVLKAHPVDRISINPQTMNQKTLDLIGRRHTVEQTKESFLLAREMGFTDINMDLIAGLPEETYEDMCHTMDEVMALNPDNLTIHSLAIKRAARLRMQREDYKDLTMVNDAKTNEMFAKRALAAGLQPYYLYRQKNMAGNFENVGYAKEGLEGLYNILIMEEKQTIIALGAGAMTKFVLTKPQMDELNAHYGEVRIPKQIIRVENVKNVEQYLARIDEMIERKRKEMEELLWL